MTARLYTLPEAAEILFGTTGKVRALRTEIHKGRLDARSIAGTYYVTETDLSEFTERCRAKPAPRACNSPKANGSSVTEPPSGELDAALMKLKLLKDASPSISPASGGQTPAAVIRLRSLSRQS